MGLNMRESLHGEDLGCDVFFRVCATLDLLVGWLEKVIKWMFPKIMGTPKSSISIDLIGFSIINHPFWGTPIFGNTQILSKKW